MSKDDFITLLAFVALIMALFGGTIIIAERGPGTETPNLLGGHP